MQLNKYNLHQALSYLAIAVVTMASIFAYTTRNWRFGEVTVGVGFLLLALFFFLSPKDDSDD